MVEDGQIYIYYGGFGMGDGKLVKVKSMEKMETHMFLRAEVDFKEPARYSSRIERSRVNIHTAFQKWATRSSSASWWTKTTKRAFSWDLSATTFIFTVSLPRKNESKKTWGHPNKAHFNSMWLRFTSRETTTRRPMVKINPIKDQDVGLMPTFEDYGTPIFCVDAENSGEWKLVAFLDKTALKTVNKEN